MTLDLRIPERDHDALAQLFELDDQELARVVDALRDVPPSLSLKVMSEEVAHQIGHAAVEVRQMLRVLRSMYLACRQFEADTDEFADAVVTAAQQTDKADLQLDESKQDAFKKQLVRILRLDEGFGVAARAVEVMGEQERLYCSARILTDVRPVFRDDVASAPAAAAILHSLRIEYHPDGRGGEYERMQFALHADDLRALRRLIDRALEKEASISSSLEAGGITSLVRDTDDENNDAS